MNKRSAILIFVFAICVVTHAQEEIPFRINHLQERVIIFTPGNFAPPSVTTVITSSMGLILIDTGLSPTLAEATKEKIKKELGRDDFRFIINTHGHFDHTSGNQIYAGATIIGHENVAAAMRQFAAGKEQFIVGRTNRTNRQQAELQSMAAGSEQATSLAETIRFNRIMISDLQTKYQPTLPTEIFSDQKKLKVADLELHLYYFGRAHTDSDILIHIPALNILFTGDLFFPDNIAMPSGPPPLQVQRWMQMLDIVLIKDIKYLTVVGGHGAIKNGEWLASLYHYMKDMSQAVTVAQNHGSDYTAFAQTLPLQIHFDYLAPFFDLKSEENLKNHQNNMQLFWRVNLKSAAAEMRRMVTGAGIDSARILFKEIRSKQSPRYYLDERELNALGYQLLGERRIAEAMVVFQMNTEAFPDSWNTWDSLGEAYLYQDDREKAEACYVKSLELNPNGGSGKAALSELRGHKLDAQGETKIVAKYGPNEKTGLNGLYLGQQPPGLIPQVFAPGIISSAGNLEFSLTCNPEATEIYFTRRKDPDGSNTLMVCRLQKDGWSSPEEAAFAQGFPSNEPTITPDGKKIYFGSNRPQSPAQPPEYGIWVSERSGNGWDQPRFHGPGMYVSATDKGDLYMTDVTNVAGGGLIRYPFVGGAYGKPDRLPDALNAPQPVAHGFVAPDESYIVFDSYQRPRAQGGEGDLFVSFRLADGSWAEAVNLGDNVNTPGTNFCPSVSPDGKYLFYSTNRDIYWVSTEVIHRLRPAGLREQK